MNSNDRSSLLWFPYSVDALPFIQWLSFFQKEYAIDAVVAQEGSGLDGKDVAWADNRPPLGITITQDFQSALERADIWLIPPFDYESLSWEAFLGKIREAAPVCKRIICIQPLNDEQQQEIVDVVSEHTAVSFPPRPTENLLNKGMADSLSMFTPDFPVVFVSGMLEDAHQPDIALGLAATLQQQGLIAGILGDSPLLNLLGFDTYSGILSDSACSSPDALILRINKLIRAISATKHPDILIVQVPGAIMRFNEVLLNTCGIYAYMFSQAITPDYHICCLPYEGVTAQFLSAISKYAGAHFDCEIRSFHLSNHCVDMMSSMEVGKVKMIRMPMEMTQARIDGAEQPEDLLSNLLDPKNLERTAKMLLQSLV